MLNYSLELRFEIATIGTRVSVTDAAGQLISYVRKKFRFKEELLLANLIVMVLLERDQG